MASMMSLVALSIDAMLPALTTIGQDLQVADPNDTQLVIAMIFLGMSIGLPFWGTLSDSMGRKPSVYMGFALFMVGCGLSYWAPTLTWLLVGRFLQGLGVAGPRVVVLALVRDQYAGKGMAKIMSFVMMIFILVPIVAPAFGQLVLAFASWRDIFLAIMVVGVAVVAWFAIRHPETLPPEERGPMRWQKVGRALKEIFKSRVGLGYTVTSGLVMGAFLGFLNSIEPILKRQYGVGEDFALYFGILAFFIGLSTLLNSRLVDRLGMQRMTQSATVGIILTALVFLAVRLFVIDEFPLWLLLVYLFITLFSVGILFGNLSSLAMEPLGHIAGTGASVVSALGTIVGLPIGVVIGQMYDGNAIPMIAGFAIFNILSLVLMRWIEAGRVEPAPQPV